MSTIGSISASSASAYTSSIQRQRPDASQIADSVFSKLDTKSQGYLEIADLESAFSSISSDTSSTTSTADSSSGIRALFKKLDSNNDGKVTKDEFSSGLKKLSDALETQFNARRTSGVGSGDDTNRPPPPNSAGGPDGAGLTKDQLTELASKVSNTNSTAGAGLSSVAQNFDAADTNQDGKVSMQETLAYLEKAASTSTSSTSTKGNSDSTSSSSTSGDTSTGTTASTSGASSSGSDNTTTSEAAMFKKVMQLLHAYAPPPTSDTNGISVSA